jgi:MFS family permease
MDDVAFAKAKIEAPAVLDRDWLAVVASAVGLMLSVGSLTIYTFGVFVGPLSAEFKWSRTELFGAVAISQYALALSVPFWGCLIDRLGPRSALVPSVVMISLLFASLAFLTPNLWHLYLIFALFPLLAGGASPLGYSAVIVRKFEGKLGQALGLALMGVGLGAAILPSFTQTLIGAFGWRETYASMGLLTLLITLPAALIATRGVERRRVGRTVAGTPPMMVMVRTRAFVLMCVFFVLLGIISVGALAHLVPMMTDRGLAPVARPRRLVGRNCCYCRPRRSRLAAGPHPCFLPAGGDILDGSVRVLTNRFRARPAAWLCCRRARGHGGGSRGGFLVLPGEALLR